MSPFKNWKEVEAVGRENTFVKPHESEHFPGYVIFKLKSEKK